MTTTRRKTIAALVVAVLLLLASAGTAVAVAASRDPGAVDDQGYATRYDDTDSNPGNSWVADRVDPGWGPMMGDGGDDYGWMMGDRGDDYGWMTGPRSSRDWTGKGPGSGWSSDSWGDSSSYGWNGTGPVSAAQAREVAQRWLDRYATSADLGEPVAMPMGYRFQASQGGTVVAMIMVEDDTGTVFGHLRLAAIR